jgi:hypothetical protein
MNNSQNKGSLETQSLLTANDDYMSINPVGTTTNDKNNSFSQHFSDQLQQTSFLFNRNIIVSQNQVTEQSCFWFFEKFYV